MSSVGISVFAGPLVFLLSSVLAAPLGGPPLPLDRTLSAIAPAKCVWYGTSAGIAEPDPKSSNQTEQLFAEAEVRYFSQRLQEQLIGLTKQGFRPGPQERILLAELPTLIQTLISRPLAAYVESFEISHDEFNLQAGLVLNAGEQRAELAASINKLVEMAIEAGAPIGTIELDGESWSVARVSMQTPEVRWGWHDNYFILAIGENTAETILERMTGSAPTWLKELRADQPFDRESTLAYVNVENLLAGLRPVLEKEKGWHIVEKLGLTSLKALHGQSGFDKLGCSSTAKLVTNGSRNGLLSLLPYKELSKRDLRGIPRDAMLATAVRVDVAETFENILRLIEEFDPEAVERLQRNMRDAGEEIGIDFEQDLIGSLGDVWTAYLPGGDLMTSWLGSSVACKVKDPARLQQTVAKIIAVAQQDMQRSGQNDVRISESDFEGQTIYTLNVIGAPLPVSPSWCVTEDWFVLGLTPQTVRSAIARRDEDSLADVEDVRNTFGNSSAPTALTYCDTPKLVQSVYPLVQMGAQLLSSQLQREGIDFDTSILPSSGAIVKHLRPSVSTMTSGSDGLQFNSQQSFPGGGNGMMLLPMALGLGVPALSQARMAAYETQEINNLRQIALAFHNYADVYGKLPTNIYDNNGEALLSWRVQLLPFMEQQALYEKFHLDEPWDSPHNRPLADLVVPQFSSSQDQAPNKTRYLALAGEETLLRGPQKLTFASIRDGLSNTILYVKAAPDAAVIWTKPEDIDFDAEKPFQGLSKDDPFISVAFADGSCHKIRRSIDQATMRALATRAGGETIDRGLID